MIDAIILNRLTDSLFSESMQIKKMNAQQLGFTEGWISIFINTMLFGLKYWAGVATGSIALIADAWHTLSDSISSVILIFGIKISGKSADTDHPFGHGRAENIATLIIAILLAIISINFLVESVAKLINKESVVFGTFAIVATVISIIGKEVLAQFAFWAGKRSNSQILKADAWHHRSDAISSVIILIGIFFGNYFWWIDGVLGLVVAALIFYAAYDIFREAISPIIGTKLDKKTIDEITDICYSFGGENLKAHHFHMHQYGKHIELTFHLKFPPYETIAWVHHQASQIEKEIRDKMGIESTIHMEPDNVK